MKLKNIVRMIGVLLLSGPALSVANTFPLPSAGNSLVGEVEYTTAKQEEDLLDIARAFGIGQREIVIVNPEVDRWLPGGGTRVLLPKHYILPAAPKRGIVVNVAEMRMYYYPAGGTTVLTHPISIGRMDWNTPLGGTSIIEKKVNPTWTPPESIKREHAAEGDPLPNVVAAGPNNPLGLFAMRLGIPGYLIHGTNKPYGVGMRVTHGCMRMYPEDIERLFPQVSVGTKVRIVNQPIKVGWDQNKLFIQIQPPFEEDAKWDPQAARKKSMALIQKSESADWIIDIDQDALKKALNEHNGMPIEIATRRSAPIEIPEDYSYSETSDNLF